MKAFFHQVAVAEGLSYLILLGIAMPLKYWAGIPDAVRYTGWAHGVLFVVYMGVLGYLWLSRLVSFKSALLAFALAFVPLGWKWVSIR